MINHKSEQPVFRIFIFLFRNSEMPLSRRHIVGLLLTACEAHTHTPKSKLVNSFIAFVLVYVCSMLSDFCSPFGHRLRLLATFIYINLLICKVYLMRCVNAYTLHEQIYVHIISLSFC